MKKRTKLACGILSAALLLTGCNTATNTGGETEGTVKGEYTITDTPTEADAIYGEK